MGKKVSKLLSTMKNEYESDTCEVYVYASFKILIKYRDNLIGKEVLNMEKTK